MTISGYLISLVIGALVIAGTVISYLGPPRTRRLGLIGGLACVVGFFATRMGDWLSLTSSLDNLIGTVGGVIGIVGIGALALAAAIPAPAPAPAPAIISDEDVRLPAYEQPCHRRIPCPQEKAA